MTLSKNYGINSSCKKGGNAMKRIYTIGHSNKTTEEFIQKLKEKGIGLVVDVRSSPYSRYCPHFNGKIIKSSLKKRGIEYEWAGDRLGGLRENKNQSEKMQKIAERCGSVKIALMCSESDPKKCHRGTDLTPKFKMMEINVEHILWTSSGCQEEMIFQAGIV
jgi:uncharacterized protein (DUF488 family)